ncbi:MAG: hypothetical protein ACI965_001791 [Paraglaciecola sp.]|jgi:hypothetical protein
MLKLFSYSRSYQNLILVFLAAFLIGLAKTGVSGRAMFAGPLLAVIFGGKVPSGLMLPLLIIADLLHYHRHANGHYQLKLFPSATLGRDSHLAG